MTATVQPITRTRVFSPLIGAIVFLGLYLAVDPVSGLFRIGSMPLPGAPASEVFASLTANGTASIATGVLQLASVAGLAVFVAATASRKAQSASPMHIAAVTAGWIAVAAMALSATVAIVLGPSATALGIDTALALRTVSFYAGGGVHVVSLGVFVFTLSRLPGWTRPVRVMAWIGAIPAVLSIASVFVVVLSILLPAGRLLAMVALVTAGASLARGRSVPGRES